MGLEPFQPIELVRNECAKRALALRTSYTLGFYDAQGAVKIS